MKLPIELLDRYARESKIDSKQIAQELRNIQDNKSTVLDDAKQFERRRKMIAEVSVEPFEDAFERYIGDNEFTARKLF